MRLTLREFELNTGRSSASVKFRELLNILTSERVRLLERAKAGSLPISDLADGLKRDVRAVSRDVVVLEKAGLLRTSYRTNPGHGRLKIVEALARAYRLTANL